MLEMHQQWMSRHGRVYKDEQEEGARFKIFKDNVDRINASIPRQSPGQVISGSERASFRYANVTVSLSAIDWRKKGAVTPVQDQGACVAAMEGIYQIKTGKLLSLSKQELVDCDVKGEDEGCNGGYMNTAFKFIKHNEGLTTEANYPYVGRDGTCKSKKLNKPVAAKITGYEDVPKNSEKALLQAVANQPVSVNIDASGDDFQFYSSGVFNGPCGTKLDHGVTAVGYGTTSDGTKYWLIKNSWGSGWGDNGYMNMKRDVAAKEGLCGIAMNASYPVMD
ncbi:hypothetical protein C3L33_06154, partial [Rhododendron williamsianum]